MKTDIRSSEAFRGLFLVPPEGPVGEPELVESDPDPRLSQYPAALEEVQEEPQVSAPVSLSPLMRFFLFSCTALLWVAIITTVLVILFFVGIVFVAIRNGL